MFSLSDILVIFDFAKNFEKLSSFKLTNFLAPMDIFIFRHFSDF